MAGGSEIRAGRAFVELLLKDGAFTKGLDKAKANLTKWGTAALATGTALGGALLGATKVFADFGDNINKASQRTGIAVKELSELSYAAGQSGTNLETLEGAVRKMQNAIVDAGNGAKGPIEALQHLGLTAAELAALKPDEQFKLIADRLSKIKDPTQRAAAAMDVFGKSGTQLLPLLEEGAAGIETLQKRAEKLGVSLSKEQAQAATVFGDALDDIKASVMGVAVQIGAALAPKLTEITDSIIEYVSRVTAFVKEHQDLIITVAKAAAGMAALGGSLIAVGQTLGILSSSIKGINSSLALLAANPAAAAIIAVTAAAAAGAIAIDRLTNYTAKLSDAQEKQLSKSDQQRAADQQATARLEQLAQKHRLNTAEMGEATNIIAQLQKSYGDLGLSINATTGKIEGMSGAQDRLNSKMKEATLAEIDAAIAENARNASELEKQMKAAQSMGQNINWDNTIFGKDGLGIFESSPGLKSIDEAAGKMKVNQAEFDALRKRRQAVTAGDKDALAGGKEAAAAGPGVVLQNEVRTLEDALKRFRELDEERTRQQRTELENQLEDLRRNTEEKKRLLVEAGRAGGSSEDFIGAQLKFIDRESAADAAKLRAKAEEEAGKERLEHERQLAADIEKAKIEAMQDGLPKQRAQLELERRQELEAAKKLGIDVSQVNELFDIRQAALGRESSKQVGPIVSFSAAELAGQFGRGGQKDKVAENVERGNTLLGEMKKLLTSIRDDFRGGWPMI